MIPSQSTDAKKADVVIVGAGIAGVCLAYYLARGGVKSLVLDRGGIAAEATGANAGFVGVSEGTPGIDLALTTLTGELYERAGQELDLPVGFERAGRLLLAQTSEEIEEREALVSSQRRHGVNLEMVYGPALLEIEPHLSREVLAAAWLPENGQIHPIAAAHAFMTTAVRLGAAFMPGVEVKRVLVSGGRVQGVVADGQAFHANQVVVAAGAWSGQLAATTGLHVPVVPGRGQMLVTEPVAPLLATNVRSADIGLSQLSGGRLVIGSEIEHVEYNKDVTAARIARFARLAVDIVPSAVGIQITRAWAGLRPMSPDGEPIIEADTGIDGLNILTGLSRSGMTTGPAAAFALSELMLTGSTSIPIEALRLSRFQP